MRCALYFAEKETLNCRQDRNTHSAQCIQPKHLKKNTAMLFDAIIDKAIACISSRTKRNSNCFICFSRQEIEETKREKKHEHRQPNIT